MYRFNEVREMLMEDGEEVGTDFSTGITGACLQMKCIT